MAKILIIDDDARLTALISRIADEMGLSGVVYDHQTDFVQFCQLHNPDLIILDVFMPDQDGFEILRLLRGFNSDLPIVMLSGDHNFCDMAAEYGTVIGLNVAHTMGKPFRIGELRNVLYRLAETDEARRGLHQGFVTKQ